MKSFTLEAKVGLFTIIGITALILIFMHYGSQDYREDKGYNFSVIFERVDGLKRGAVVQVAGVTVGEILSVSFNKEQKVEVVVKIHSSDVDIDRDSLVLVDSGIVGEKWLSVRPKSDKPKSFIKKDGTDVLYGETPVNLQDLTKDVQSGIAQITETVQTIDITVNNINKIVGDEETQVALKDSVMNVRRASEELNRLLVNAGGHIDDISAGVQSTLVVVSSELEMTAADVRDNLDLVSGDVYRFTNTLNRIAGDNETDVRQIVKNLQETSIELQTAMASVNALVGDEEISEDIKETLKSLKRTSATIEETATNLQAFVTDEELQADLKDTIANARSTLENADAILSDTREFLAKRDTLIPTRVDYELILTGAREDNGDIDGSADILSYLYNKSGNTFLQAGLTDVNEDNRMNLQLGRIWDNNQTLRFGIIKAKFGFGYDFGLTERTSINLDVFDMSDLTMDVKGRYKINDRVDIILGVDNLFQNENEVKLGTGIKL